MTGPIAFWRSELGDVTNRTSKQIRPGGRLSRNRISADVIHPSDLDEGLAAKWQEFRRATPIYSSPFYAPQFTQTVGKVFKNAEVAILADNHEVIGFLPFHRVRNRVAKPIGGQINDYHGPILAPGAGSRHANCFVHATLMLMTAITSQRP